MALKFTRSSYKASSSICADIAQVFFAAFVAAVVVLPIDTGKFIVLILELGFAIGFWIASLLFAEKGKL